MKDRLTIKLFTLAFAILSTTTTFCQAPTKTIKGFIAASAENAQKLLISFDRYWITVFM
ncbi:MAG: hypothetical protein ACFB15_13145 [Cyclobacteriaceae bacterium]